MDLTILHNAFKNIYRNIIISIVNKKKKSQCLKIKPNKQTKTEHMTEQKKHSEEMNPPTRWRHRPERTGKQKQINTNPGTGSKATSHMLSQRRATKPSSLLAFWYQ